MIHTSALPILEGEYFVDRSPTEEDPIANTMRGVGGRCLDA